MRLWFKAFDPVEVRVEGRWMKSDGVERELPIGWLVDDDERDEEERLWLQTSEQDQMRFEDEEIEEVKSQREAKGTWGGWNGWLKEYEKQTGRWWGV